MNNKITYSISSTLAKKIIELAKESQQILDSDERNESQFPPVSQLNDSLQSFVKTIFVISSKTKSMTFEPDIETLQELNSDGKAEAYCNFDSYKDLFNSTQIFRLRATNTAPIYRKLIVNPLSQILENPGVTKDKISNQEVDGLLTQLRTRQKDLNLEVKKATESIDQQARVHLNHIEREFKKSITDIRNGTSQLESEALMKIESLSTETQIKLQELASAQRNELSEITAKHIDEAFESKRQAVFEQLSKDSKKEMDKVSKEVGELSKKVADEINEFFLLNEALRKTLSYVSSDALADATISQAKEEKQAADKLRLIGVSWLVFAIFLFLTTFDYQALVDENGIPQYTLILLRSFFLIVGSAPGFYLLRESARHRTDERRYRQKGIQLATIDGYLAEFEESDRNTVKKELTKHYFHGGDHFVDSSSVDNVQGTYDKILDRILASEKDRNKPEA